MKLIRTLFIFQV